MARIAFLGKNKIRNFNAPRQTGHTVVRPRGIPAHKFWKPMGGVFLPMWTPPDRRYDMIHSFNSIPTTRKPWVVTFEGVLPRVHFGTGYKILEKVVRERLVKSNCRHLIAMSEFAKNKMRERNAGWKNLEAVLAKTTVLHPSVLPQEVTPKKYLGKDEIRLVFVGNAFARKGGIVALRLAKLANEEGFPLKLDLVSSMVLKDYTDHLESDRYKADLQLMNQPNVCFHHQLPSAQVLELMRKADFQLLATLSDTYGYSIIEGFSMATPAIATSTCAIPENVIHGKTGYLLNLPVNEWNDWVLRCRARDHVYRSSDEYWGELDKTFDDLARQALNTLIEFRERQTDYEYLSEQALLRANTEHNAVINGQKLNQLYDEILA